MLVTSIHFRKRKYKQWAYISGRSGVKSQVDYILIERKWKSPVNNCETFITFSSIRSDHCIVISNMKLSLKIITEPPENNIYDLSSLQSSELQHIYNGAVKKKQKQLRKEGKTVTETYINFIIDSKKPSSCLLPKKKLFKRKRIASDMRIVNAR